MGDTLALVPARGGSKGVERKNIRECADEPLLAYSVRAGLEAASVDRTVVSTDDEEIRDIAREVGADAPFLRPAEYATDEAPMEPVVRHALEYLRDEAGEAYDEMVLLQPTTPLRDAAHVDVALEQYRDTDADSLVSVVPDHSYRWRRTDEGAVRVNYQGDRRRRQAKDPEYVENGAIYVVDAAEFLETDDLHAGRTTLFVMDETPDVDIDTPFDLWLADRILEVWKDA